MTPPPLDRAAPERQNLLPCPFCQGTRMTQPMLRGRMIRTWHVECRSELCKTIGPAGKNPAEAIAAWNKRAPDTAAHAAGYEAGMRDAAAIARRRHKRDEYSSAPDFPTDGRDIAAAIEGTLITPSPGASGKTEQG